MTEQIQKAADFIRSFKTPQPTVGIILGTGLGALAKEVNVEVVIPYETIPHFPLATVESHSGKLLLGTLSGKQVMVMQGRFHYYEGYSMQQVTFPVRVMRWLGVETLLISNASGGLNPDFEISDLMIIEDHISLFLPENPLRGPHPAQFGDRFPDMSEPYSKELVWLARSIAQKFDFPIQRGVYCGITGPQLETKAEYRLLRQLGGDAVGMSTVPEVIVAHQMGLKVLACSVITDLCIPETLEKVSFIKVLAAAATAEPRLTALFREIVARL
ncbi:purine-nucleoside phosphorylase [Larkinella rosea]|uniref:Purine nucleoside phosphorylase n=1 Tax=Larkinella rosea TaxID=2025312 RepID=A0A3P1C090_9BACT|nr:purine-nucleoside phosphorylase [Larkinella rosea]RRB06821.1 purine-nucleoside phosphorylase [Larkinella rosea]